MIVRAAVLALLALLPASASRAEDKPLPACAAGALVSASGRPLTPLASSPVVFPAIGEEASVEVGQSMILIARYAVYEPSAYLYQSINYSPPASPRMKIHIGAGRLPYDSSDGRGSFFIARDGSVTGVSALWRGAPVLGVYIPHNPEAPSQIFMIDGSGRFDYPVSDLHLEVERCSNLGVGSFRRELVYSGTSKGSVNLLYREYLNDFARPAFSQELSYDLSAGAEIGFRGARIRIIAATNVGIRYVVLKPFDADPQ